MRKRIFAMVIVTAFCLSCNEGSDQKKEDISDYYASEYFKAEIDTPYVSREQMISLAGKERLTHGDKEGGIIKFKTAGIVWGYVEYHYPEQPDKVNAKDEFNRPIEVKIY